MSSDESDETIPGRPNAAALIGRAARLKCPACGRGDIFYGLFAMHLQCRLCGRKFQRDPGYFLGSIYFNYGVTAFLMMAGYFAMYFAGVRIGAAVLIGLAAFTVFFPLWFFRYARALWIAFDERFDPSPDGTQSVQPRHRATKD